MVEVDSVHKRSLLTIWSVSGTATNVSGRNLDMASIFFGVYNPEGMKVGQAIDTMAYLADGDVWKFNAVLATSLPQAKIGRVDLERVVTR